MSAKRSDVDRLEGRFLLSTTFDVSNRVLEIDGDSSRNFISVYFLDSNLMLSLGGGWEQQLDYDDFDLIRINGGGGSDRIVVHGESGRVALRIIGGSGDDQIRVETTNSARLFVISGGSGDDTVRSTGALNELFGGDGDDSLYATTGRATLAGGSGDDKLSVQGSSAINDIRILRGNAGRDTLIGSESSDHLIGDGGRDRMYGNGGDDSIEGGSGIDAIFGGSGSDTIFGGNQADIIVGGEGSDVFVRMERIWNEVRDYLRGEDFQY